MDDFSRVFKTPKSDVSSQASSYACGLFQTPKQNIEKVSEQAPGCQYHQLQHFISHSPWDDAVVDNAIKERASNLLKGRGPVGLIFDPTGIPKKGLDSVGVGRQWIGNQGKVDNGQVAVTAALVNGRDSCLIDKELYLPRSWVEDEERCDKAGIPIDRRLYRSHQEIVSEMIERIDEQGISYNWIGMDAEFGNPAFLHQLDDLGKQFLVDTKQTLKVFPRSPKIRTRPKRSQGKSKKLSYRIKPVAINKLIDGRRWKRVTVRQTTKGMLEVDFQHRKVWVIDSKTGKARPYHLVIRRDRGKTQTRLKYSLSNVPLETTTEDLAFMQAQRFWVEHSIKEGKQQAGMDNYQVRLWRGWHHHFTMAMLVELFMMEMRLKYEDQLPLLTAGDIWDFLFHYLPRKTDSVAGLIEMIQTRYRKREKNISYYFKNE